MNLQAAQTMALDLMTKHGLRNWGFEFDRAKNRAGQCRLWDRVISLSRPYVELNSEASVRDTILHEIAHALSPLGSRHNWVWQQKAREVGADPRHVVADDNTKFPEGNIVGFCSEGCTSSHRMHRMPRRGYRCRRCKVHITWSRR